VITVAKIHLLNELTANQIAAGEVIERPASVVKELVENSLDAGARNINVAIEGGGLTAIRVSDDGEGMSREDALLAVKRHATSKLKSIGDLDKIRSLGFRGEALPSIVAVSRAEIVTREKGMDFGARLKLEGNNLLSAEPAGAPYGTAVSVSELFFNTPARKKFMRSQGYEGGLIHELMMQLALSHPGVNFLLTHHGKEILNTIGIDSTPDLIASFYGKDVKENLFCIDNKINTGTIKAYLTLPTVHRANRKGIHFFVNSRRVITRELISALDESYENTLPKSRFPVAAIYLELSPELIDVNIHPSKLEIKFRDRSVVSELSALVKENLQSKKHTPAYLLDLPGSFSLPGAQKTPQRVPNQPAAVQERIKDFYSRETQPLSSLEVSHKFIGYKTENVLNIPLAREAKAAFEEQESEENVDKEYKILAELNGSIKTVEAKSAAEINLPVLRVIGQLHASFILAEGEEGLYLIDQHAAHERIIFEQLLLDASKGQVKSQLLLTPLTLQLTALEEELVIENILPLTDMGVVLEHFGPRSYLLRAVPDGLKEGPQDFFHSLLDLFGSKNKRLSPADIRKEFLITLSCKSAVKAGQKLPHEAQVQLIRDLYNSAHALTCPHGRPTLFHIPASDILKAFRRQ